MLGIKKGGNRDVMVNKYATWFPAVVHGRIDPMSVSGGIYLHDTAGTNSDRYEIFAAVYMQPGGDALCLNSG